MGEVHFQPKDCWKPEDHIPFEGDHRSFQYHEYQDVVDVIASQKYVGVLPALQHREFEVAIFNPIIDKYINAGDSGILVAHTATGMTYHMEALCTSVGRQDWMMGESWQNADIINYTFQITKVQIGNTEYYVVRVDMGDGTYVELLMTEAEKEKYGTKGFTERYLNQLAVNRW